MPQEAEAKEKETLLGGRSSSRCATPAGGKLCWESFSFIIQGVSGLKLMYTKQNKRNRGGEV